MGVLSLGVVSPGCLSLGLLAIVVGFSEATGTLLEADALTGSVRERIVSLLNETVPPLLSWLKGLLVLFL